MNADLKEAEWVIGLLALATPCPVFAPKQRWN